MLVTELGMVTFSKELQLAKAEPSISVTEFGIVKLFNELHPEKALHPIFVTELGMVTFSKELQPAKAEPLISVTEFGIVKLLNELHPEKALDPILVTELGMVTFSKELQPAKAQPLISVTEFGIDKVWSELRRWKALLPIWPIDFGMMANAWTLIIESVFRGMGIQPEWRAFHIFQATSIVQMYSKRRRCLRFSIDVHQSTVSQRYITINKFEHKRFQKKEHMAIFTANMCVRLANLPGKRTWN